MVAVRTYRAEPSGAVPTKLRLVHVGPGTQRVGLVARLVGDVDEVAAVDGGHDGVLLIWLQAMD